jgi:Zn finger protein HypA/HybF involved in hydrogenase expression
MKSNKQSYIEECNLFHNNKYDYSLIDLKDTKIKIICPTHGIFEQDKRSHKKYGCRKCAAKLRGENQSLGIDKFIEKASEIHGNKYDYSLVKYRSNNIKVEIICKEHGEFMQVPLSHLCGNGCPVCGAKSGGLKNSHDKDKFIEKASKIHGEKYDYSLVKYTNNNTKVIIICKEHGEFSQLPNNHLSGQDCPKCKGLNKTISDFIKISNEIHGEKYDYSQVIFGKMEDSVIIVCKKHGKFLQTPNGHINKKNGCPKCKGLNKTTQDFINESRLIHGNLYDYSKTEYVLAKKPLIIICNKHGDFSQAPTHHLSGQGCPVCKSSKGEKKVTDILNKMKINFKHHHIFKDFTNYEYDFFIPEKNLCIEYDGIQHFQPVNYFGGKEAFKTQQIRDKIKNEYCFKNNIKLIRISYIEKDIENILNKI